MVKINIFPGPFFFFLGLFCFGAAFPCEAAGPLIKGDHNYPPYEYLDANDHPAGFNVDITQAVAREMGMDIQIVLGPWNEIRQELETGKIDALMGMFNTQERDKMVDFTIPHLIASYAIFVRKGSRIKSLSDVRGKTILAQNGDMGHDYIRQHKLTPDIAVKDNMSMVLAMLSRGQGDCAIVPRLQGLILIREKKLDNIEAVGEPIIQRKYCLAVRQGDSGLLAKLNEGLSIIKTSGEYDKIYEKWFGVYEHQQNKVSQLVRYIALAAGPLLILTIAFFIWSRTLKKQVAGKTRELSLALQQIDDILYSMPSVVISLDNGGRVRHWNPKAEERTGVSISGAVGRKLDSLISHPIITPACIREVLKTGETFRQSRVSDKSGTNVGYEDITVYALSGRAGVVIHMEDVTEQVRMEEMMIQSEKMMSLGGMAAGIAHEINNPLAGMTQTAELLGKILDEDLNPDKAENVDFPWDIDQINCFMASKKIPKLLSNIRVAGQKASMIVSNMLAFAGSPDDRKVRCRISRILDETMELAWSTHHPLYAYRSEQISCKKAYEDLDIRVACEPTTLAQVFLNIIQNSLYAVNQRREQDGSYIPCLNLSVAPTKSGEEIEIIIGDNGPGLDPSLEKKIFDPFFTTKPPGIGTGLGLSIAYFIVTQTHKGDLWVKSEPNQGARFIIRLPR